MVDKLETFAERLKYLRKKSGLSLAAVAKQLGVSPQAVHKWEAGGNVEGDRKLEVSGLFGVDPLWLLTGQVPPGGIEWSAESDHDLNMRARLGFPAATIPMIPDEGVFVPLLNPADVAAWLSRGGDAAPTSGVRHHAGDWLACPRKHGDDTYALRLPDSSMEDIGSRISYSEGDIIFVDPSVKAWADARVVIIPQQSEGAQLATFRQLVLEGWEVFREPLNKQWPEQRVKVDKRDVHAGTVIGKWVDE